jgi:chorismate synthase
MSGLRFLTSGESHGRALTGILEGVPSGFSLSSGDIDGELRRRQGGYGRGGRMKIESDRAEILSGVRWGKTLGSPISILIENRDWENWRKGMSPGAADSGSIKPVTRPRPGHADLAGALKYDFSDVRNVLERSSARETAMRVALGAIAKKVLSEFGITVGSYVVRIGGVHIAGPASAGGCSEEDLLRAFAEAEGSEVRCPDRNASARMKRLIDKAKGGGDSLGGVFEVFVTNVPAGLGSHVHWDRKIDGRLSQAVMSIQAMKGVEIGMGFGMAGRPGSSVMDEIFYKSSKFKVPATGGSPGRQSSKVKDQSSQFTVHGSRFFRKTNSAGGIEGGMTNGMPVLLRAAMKPIPTLRRPLISVDIRTKKAFEASYERSDICAVPAAAVVAEAAVSLVVADALLEKTGGDSRREVMRNFKAYLSYLDKF